MIWLRIYSLVWLVCIPFVYGYLMWRARKAPTYLEHWDERFGKTTVKKQPKDVVWIHTVSVGETRAALPLIEALRKRYPNNQILLTLMTPTGREAAVELYGKSVELRYLPYDFPKAVNNFMLTYRPKFGVLIETELWPNLIFAAKRANVPLFLANARLSQRSFQRYHRFAPLIYPMMQQLRATMAQSEEDAQRLIKLGANPVEVCGNIKYDIEPPKPLLKLGKHFRSQVGKRLVFVCASTREGEEKLILQAWRKINPEGLLVIIPRHPERFDEVYQLACDYQFIVQRRSENQPIREGTQLWLGDSMGELFAYYQMADVVFVGGSLQPLGSHSLIEPAAVGRPIIFGPSTFNFAKASQLALAAGAARQVTSAEELIDTLIELQSTEYTRRQMSKAALEFSALHRGATNKMVKIIEEKLISQEFAY